MFAYLVDPHGAIKVTLWEQFSELEEGKTYNFQNLQVKEYNSNGVYLSTPKTGCTITKVEPFSQPLFILLTYLRTLPIQQQQQKYLEWEVSLHIKPAATVTKSW